MRVPTPIVASRISRLVDAGVDLQAAIGVSRVRSFEDLQRTVAEYSAWSADIVGAVSRSFDPSIVKDDEAVHEPTISIDDQSQAEVIRLLRTAIDQRLKWLAALNGRIAG